MVGDELVCLSYLILFARVDRCGEEGRNGGGPQSRRAKALSAMRKLLKIERYWCLFLWSKKSRRVGARSLVYALSYFRGWGAVVPSRKLMTNVVDGDV